MFKVDLGVFLEYPLRLVGPRRLVQGVSAFDGAEALLISRERGGVLLEREKDLNPRRTRESIFRIDAEDYRARPVDSVSVVGRWWSREED